MGRVGGREGEEEEGEGVGERGIPEGLGHICKSKSCTGCQAKPRQCGMSCGACCCKNSLSSRSILQEELGGYHQRRKEAKTMKQRQI